MDTDQEGLLSSKSSSTSRFGLTRSSGGGVSRWRKSILFMVVILGITACLAVYLYLNMAAFDGNQSDPNRFKPLSRRKPMLDHESIFSDSGPSMLRLSDLLAHCIVALRIAGREVVDLSLAHKNKLNHVGSKGKTLEGAQDVVTSVDLKSHEIIVKTIKDSYRRLRVVSEEDSTKAFENTSADDDLLPIKRTEFAQLLRSDLHQIEIAHPEKSSMIAQHETLVWIDPLDATMEYTQNLTNYVTLMACIVHRSVPIAGVIFKPFTNETFWSILDVETGKHHFSADMQHILGSTKSVENSNDIRILVSRSHAGNVKSILESGYGDRVNIIPAGGSGYKTIELLSGEADAYIHLTHIKKWDVCAPYAIMNSVKGGKLTDLRGQRIEFGEPKDKVITSGLVATLEARVHEELLNLTRNLGN